MLEAKAAVFPCLFGTNTPAPATRRDSRWGEEKEETKMDKRATLGSLLVIVLWATGPALQARGLNGQRGGVRSSGLRAGGGFHPQRYVPHELLVKFKRGTPDYVQRAIHRGVGASVLRRFHADPRLERILLPGNVNVDAALAYYSTRADVQYAQKNFIYHTTETVPDDAYFTAQWAWKNTLPGANPLASVNASEAWDKSRGRFGVIVADIDSGVDYTHPDLALNIWTNPGEAGANCTDGIDNDADGYADDCRGWNFWSGTNDPMDDYGHGTHIAGTIGALANNLLGVAGANWDVQIMPLKFTDNQGNGNTALAVEALDYAVAHGATISNFSSGYYGANASGFDYAFDDAIKRAGAAGLLFVTAAGNNSTDVDSNPFYPCAFSQASAEDPNPPANILCVAATDSNDNLASFSNYGTATVQLGAPGVGIWSTWPHAGYLALDGTSQAAPHVAGGAALLKACKASLSSATIKAILIGTARHDLALSGYTSTGGVVNYQAAINDPRVGACDAAPGGSAPVADAGGPYNSNLKRPVQFDGTASSDSGGQLLLYFWDFGDGTYGAGATPSHQYALRGAYTVTLTVRDNLGGESSASATVTVRPWGQGVGLGPNKNLRLNQ
jgi:subtilisin family serine protease